MLKKTKKTINPIVLKAIQKEEDRSEKLIGILQFSFVVMMGVFYTIAPKGFSESASVLFRPVPVVLGIYAILLLIRMLFSILNRMHGAVLYVFVVVDFVLLIALIWSYHLQYQQPISVSFKAPTYVFLFLFIALRSLRFDVGYIIVAFCAGTVGWLGMLIYSFYFGNVEVTSSFVEYATSDTLLIGAEIERLIGLVITGIVLAIGVWRSRAMLTFSQQQSMAVQSMSNFFSPEIAERIAKDGDSLRPGVGQTRTAVSMQIDLRAFTKFSIAHEPSEVMKTLSSYQARLVPLIIKHGGSIDKYLGDGILVHFGAVDDDPNFVANSFRTAEAIIFEMKKWNAERAQQNIPQLGFGVGSSLGEVVFGTVGDNNRLEFTVIGRSVNGASKYQDHNKKLKTMFLSTKRTYQTAIQQGYQPTLQYKKYEQQQVVGLPDAVDLVGI